MWLVSHSWVKMLIVLMPFLIQGDIYDPLLIPHMGRVLYEDQL